MKSYILRSPKNIEVTISDIPKIREDEVLIKVTNIAICGSDIHLFDGDYNGPHKYPLLIGHEWSGIVSETGKNVTKVKKNDAVTGDCSKYCRNCEYCRIDMNLCKNIEKFGITIDGASAEYIVRNENYIYKAPGNIELDLICISEPVSVALHLIDKIKNYIENFHDKKILICGSGPLGLSSLIILKKLYNCSDIYLSDINEKRLKVAEQLGGKIFRGDLSIKVTEKSDYGAIYSDAKFDVIIEATGNPEVFKKTFELAKPTGIIGCLGIVPPVTINQRLIVLKSLTLTGSIGGTGEFERVFDLIGNNGEMFKKIVSHKIDIDNIYDAFAMSKNYPEVIKVELLL